MKEWLKAYMASTWKTYRIVMFAVYPLVLLFQRLISIAMMTLNAGDPDFNPYLIFAMLEGFGAMTIFLFEALSDIWLFPGVYSKDTGFAALPRTSLLGKKVIVGTVKGDLARSIFMTVLFFVSGVIGPALSMQEDLEKFMILALGFLAVALAAVEAAVFWLRHITNMSLAGLPLMVVYLTSVLSLAGFTVLAVTRLDTAGGMVFFAEIAIVALFAAFLRVNIRKAESVYDAGFSAEEEK
ncbi:MAG: hypothetical protein VZQ80_00735 [Lachnospiraceae bacterium]|nr:hypothetical protein [Lachnospiraceae bacterium]